MAHRVVSAQVIKELEDTVAYFDTLLSNVKSYSAGDKDSIKAAMDVLREWEFDAAIKKDKHLATGKDEDANLARRWQGKQEAYQDVITLFEAPKDVIERYGRDRADAVKRLEEYKKLDQRDI